MKLLIAYCKKNFMSAEILEKENCLWALINLNCISNSQGTGGIELVFYIEFANNQIKRLIKFY